MKRISAAKNVCMALAGLAAAATLAYAMTFVVWAPVVPAASYARQLQPRPPSGPHEDGFDKAKVVAAVARPDLGDVTPKPAPPPRFDATLAGTTVSPDPKRSTAVVNTASGQSLVRVGDRFQSARLEAIAAGSATFDFLGTPIPLKIKRSDK